MPTYEQDLILRAREVQRLATKRSKLKRMLKALDKDLRTARKGLAAVKDASEGRRPDIAPSRLDGGATGYARLEGYTHASANRRETWCGKPIPAPGRSYTLGWPAVTCIDCLAAREARK